MVARYPTKTKKNADTKAGQHATIAIEPKRDKMRQAQQKSGVQRARDKTSTHQRRAKHKQGTRKEQHTQ